MIHHGDCLTVLRERFADKSVQCCVTSPPYWGLRDYGVKGQLGLEKTPEEYVSKMVEVFREVRRVLKDDGTLWLNLGDTYNNFRVSMNGQSVHNGEQRDKPSGRRAVDRGLKEKDLVGIPWMTARALQAPYYSGKIAREIDRVWLAAMIDAEGTICGFTHVRKDNGETRNGIHIHVTNSNQMLLDKCFGIWPTTREEHNQHSEGHLGDLPTWRWIVHGIEQKSALLRELYPYFVGKKKQALLAWNFLEISRGARGRNKGEEGNDNRDKYAWIVNALSRLNHLEQVDIPSWCKEPPSLYEDGWYLRSDIIWHKPNPMPESVTDRPTKAHEYIFLLTKSERYYYDYEAIKEPAIYYDDNRKPYAPGQVDKRGNGHDRGGGKQRGHGRRHDGFNDRWDQMTKVEQCSGLRNKRSVWTVATQPYSEAHFATFPPKLIEPCILAGCPSSGLVLDPFAGSGTTIEVAQQLGRQGVGIELNPDYIALAEKRTAQKGLPL